MKKSATIPKERFIAICQAEGVYSDLANEMWNHTQNKFPHLLMDTPDNEIWLRRAARAAAAHYECSKIKG